MHSGLRAQLVLSVIQVYHRAWRGPQAGGRKQETRILLGLSPSVALAEFGSKSATGNVPALRPAQIPHLTSRPSLQSWKTARKRSEIHHPPYLVR